ncbi:acyltransferase family protein [Microbacterium sp. IEGM 1404]|uniref:acyltransferase family protein n=1 Tax=Microbacterium sp. IEGM 1404 TaxID=3047084 RepID=UPI0024B79FDF|nr:acyltransferase [Microbacterium sp. IEGM 1404]MDI9890372.1 acyltransferase [Microbacterium sp. IEGM 1404]
MVPDLILRDRSRRAPATIGGRLDPGSNSLNALRLGLALLVLIAHAWELGGYGLQTKPLGPWAVAGFFCISGYLIALSRARGRGVGEFFARRAVRIYPAFLVVLVVVAFAFAPAASAFLGAGPWSPSAGALYVLRNAGLWIAQPTIPGMLADIPYPGVWNGSLWTLAFEFACYVVTGLLGCLAVRWGARITVALWAGAMTASVLSVLGLLPVPGTLATFATLLAFYLSGTLLFLGRDRVPVRPGLIMAAAAVVAAVAISGAPTAIAGPAMAYLVLSLGIVLPLRRIGARNDISYGIYIYAFPVQQMLALVLAERGVPVVVPLVLAIVVTVPLAWASWLFVERPAMRAHRRWSSRRRTAGLA